jgi:hypothetical protein
VLKSIVNLNYSCNSIFGDIGSGFTLVGSVNGNDYVFLEFQGGSSISDHDLFIIFHLSLPRNLYRFNLDRLKVEQLLILPIQIIFSFFPCLLLVSIPASNMSFLFQPQLLSELR